jgi:hypothetical protein
MVSGSPGDQRFLVNLKHRGVFRAAASVSARAWIRAGSGASISFASVS